MPVVHFFTSCTQAYCYSLLSFIIRSRSRSHGDKVIL